MPIHSGDDRRRLVPLALIQVFTTLIDELEDAPDHKRAELRSLRSRLCRVYGVQDPSGRANASSVAQGVEDDDGIPIED